MQNNDTPNCFYYSSSRESDEFDIITHIFSDDELESFVNFQPQVDTSSPLTIREKCYLILSSTPCLTINSPVSSALNITQNADQLQEYRQNRIDPASLLCKDGHERLIAVKRFVEGDYYTQFLESISLSDKGKGEIFTAITNYLSGKTYSIDCPIIFKDETIYKTFVYCLAVSYYENICTQIDPEPDSMTDYIVRARTYKAFVEAFKEKYYSWEDLITSSLDINRLMTQLGHFYTIQDELSEREKNIGAVYATFILYYLVYSETFNWHKHFFDNDLPLLCQTPLDKLNFVNMLKVHPFCDEFCREYEEYTKSQGISPVFSLRLVFPSIPELTKDKNDEHASWFEPIYNSKIKGGSKEALYNAVCSLFDRLRKENLIASTTIKNLFVYRFTGFLNPQPIDINIEWVGTNMNTLAYMLNCLYYRKDGDTQIIKPPYSKLSEFFTPKLSNGTSLANSLARKKKTLIVKLLEECGFVDVNPDQIKH